MTIFKIRFAALMGRDLPGLENLEGLMDENGRDLPGLENLEGLKTKRNKRQNDGY
jgi:hypothetical protein